jgi:quinol monooxygenase YgiN
MVTVIAHYVAKPGTADDIAATLAQHVAATRAEPGCLEFSACRDVDDPDRFALFEQYVDEAAFQSHRETAHFREYIEGRVAPLLDERTWRRYETLDVAPH